MTLLRDVIWSSVLGHGNVWLGLRKESESIITVARESLQRCPKTGALHGVDQPTKVEPSFKYLERTQHSTSKFLKPLLQDFPSSKLIGKPKLLRQIPIVPVKGISVQHTCYERIACTYRAVRS